MVAEAVQTVERTIELRGGNLAAYDSRAREILLEGPSRTGKTFSILQKMHNLAKDYPGFKGLIVRKTAVTMGGTVLDTLTNQVFTEWDMNARRSVLDGVYHYGGSNAEPEGYVYSNGSRINHGGMDAPSKILGAEYDMIFFNQAEEADEEDAETLITRLSGNVLPHRRIYFDCNPSYDRHWLLKRAQRGQMAHFKSTLRDNPRFFDADGNPTEDGLEYLESIGGLTGTRYQRLVLGEWVGMENAIYADALDADTMFVGLPDAPGWTGRGCGGMDFGRIHLSAVVGLTESHDGRLWVRECWTGHNDRAEIMGAAERFRHRYGIRRGVTDPLQDWASQDLGWTIAKSGAGSRKGRIQRVLGLLENDMLRFDRYGEGVQELWDELHMYRYEVKETDTMIDDVVVRKDDDRVAALEYAVEAWFQPQLNFVGGESRSRKPALAQRARAAW